MRKIVVLATCGVLLAACKSDEAPIPKITPETPDACGASAYEATIGTHHADHDFTDGGRPLRIIPPNSAVTMDHRPNRLNVDVDEDGVVTRIWCG